MRVNGDPEKVRNRELLSKFRCLHLEQINTEVVMLLANKYNVL